MMKTYRKTMIFTSILILLPILAGVMLWNQLPAEIATNFGTKNEVTDTSSKPFVVFGIPLFMLVLQWIYLIATVNDPKKKNISKKILGVLLWLVPIITILTMSLIYLNALGIPVNVGRFANLLIGVLFMVIGNYLPKCRQNYSVGIRCAWTLSSEENWNRTHRLAGWVYLLAGILFLVNSIFLWTWLMVAVIVLACTPMLYSYLLYKKGI